MSNNTSNEELRKVQVTGGSTFIISLPKSWVSQMGLQKGSVLRILQRDDMTLQIKPEGFETTESTRKVAIVPRSDETPESLVRRVVSAYLIGYNILQIRSNQMRIDSAQRLAVKDFTRKKLVGTEILSDLPKELTLQVLLSYSDLSVKDALRRMSVIAASMHREAITALSSDNGHIAREIISMDDEVDRFNLYIVRLLKVAVNDVNILKESGLKTPRECLGYRLITKSVERMADHAVNIAQNKLTMTLTTLDPELLSELQKFSEFALRIYEKSMEAVFDEDYLEADRVLSEAQTIRGLEAEALHKIVKYAPAEDIPALRLIIESISRTAEYGSDIAETVLNMTIKDVVIES